MPLGMFVGSKIVRVGGREIFWQPVLGHVSGADLVIVEQATKLLVNYVLLAQQALGRTKFAFWGHGENFQRFSAGRIRRSGSRSCSRRARRSAHARRIPSKRW